jgi:predicted hydrocarbon binding protein
MMFMKTKNGFEAQGIKSDRPACILQASIYDGVSEIIANKLADQSSEGKEVKCQAKGDDSCVLAIKFKPKNSPALDWKELESEWREHDKVDLGLD